MKSVGAVIPSNIGWLQAKLDDKEMGFLWDCIKDPQRNMKKDLAGNITDSWAIIDKDNWFWENVLYKLCLNYGEVFRNMGDYAPLDKSHPYSYFLSSFWANRQKQNEFNPQHNHSGVYSFVIWMKVPFHYKQQNKNPIAADSNLPRISSFEFTYNDLLGGYNTYQYNLCPEDEGTLLFFPSKLYHQVYPFYDCKEDRISISGNVAVEVLK